ncbi:MAG: tryptophan synthase subunit alpha [Bacteroidales bacterium]
MNRIDKLFQTKSNQILSVYFTAGYPKLNDTGKIIETLEEAGVDMIEVGIPFSDPMVDGPTIQESNKLALENGMNLNLLFDQISKIRKKTSIPLLLMGYLNPVYHFGLENFCRSCHNAGIDGAILPDLPVDIYRQHYKKAFNENNLHNVFLVTPSTSEERLNKILPESSGFIYMVSSSSTTGSTKDIKMHLSYVDVIRNIKPEIPVMVGFGISDRKRFLTVCEHANGGIIGSAFIKTLAKQGDLKTNIRSFIQSIKMEYKEQI